MILSMTVGDVQLQPVAITHRTRHGHVTEALGMRILDGHVQPGETLPNESALCADLGVGRGTLREAVKALEAKGLVESRPRTGTRVRPRDRWNFLDSDLLRWMQRSDSLRLLSDLADLRRSIEPGAARLAAERATDEDRASLHAAYDLMMASCRKEGLEGFSEADLAFHMALLHACHNDLYVSLGHAIEIALRASFERGMAVPGAVSASIPRHQLILSAIMVGDGDAASAAAIGLIDAAVRDIDAAIRLMGAES